MLTPRRLSVFGGAERVSFLLSRCLRDRGWDVDALSAQHLVRKTKFNAVEDFALSLAVGRLAALMASHYELIVSTNGWGAWAGSKPRRININCDVSAAMYLAMRALTLKYRIGRWSRQYIERRSGEHAYNVAISRQIKEQVERYYGNRVARIIEPGIHVDYYQPISDDARASRRERAGISPDTTVVLFVGRMEERKGTDLFNDVSRRFSERRPAVRFVVAAPTLEAEWQAEGIDYRIGTSNAEVRELYRIADVLFFPSRYEGYGLAPMEALAAGTPVIASPVGVLSELPARDPELGRWVASQIDLDELHGRLVQYCELDLEDRRQLRHRARAYAERWCTIERFNREWLDTIAEVME
ncbi:MAG: glycosyltransferase family 4 protein [Chloroflexi bacterium]|nr:glycosyltransferase family 4 protein [Chloroflexota bacterium]